MKKGTQVDLKTVLAEDKTSLNGLQGFLSKRSTKGHWQKRYFCISNQYLNYFSSRKMAALRASCDLTELTEDPEFHGRFGEFSLQLASGQVRLKAKSLKEAEDWCQVISERKAYFSTGPGATLLDGEVTEIEQQVPHTRTAAASSSSSDDTAPGTSDVQSSRSHESASSNDTKKKSIKIKRITGRKETAVKARDVDWEAEAQSNCVKNGWLMKKSPSRFKAWQSRHFRLVDGALYYYKNEKLGYGSFQGRVIIDNACEFKIQKDATEDGAPFALVTPLRVYELKAESEQLRDEWIAALQAHRTAVETKRQTHLQNLEKLEDEELEQERRRLEKEAGSRIPDWMIEWDEMDPTDRLEKIQLKLSQKFKNPGMSVEPVLVAGTGLIEELDELSAECLSDLNRPDILLQYVRAYHLRVEHEIGFFIVGPRFDHLSLNDILRLMDLVTAYDDFHTKLISSPFGEQLKDSLPPSTMSDNLDRMIDRYLTELQDSLGTWVENIIRTSFSRGFTCIEFLSQGSTMLCTSAPIDLFNMVNETLVMAGQSGVDRLQAPVLSCCLFTIAEYIANVIHDIQRTERGQYLAKDLRFLCALTNDCYRSIDFLDELERGGFGKAAKEFDLDWEGVRVKYDQAALGLITMITDMINADLEEVHKALFTPKHLEVAREDIAANVMARIAATLQDYLEDIKQYINPTYFNKLIRMTVRDTVTTYFQRFIALSPVAQSPTLYLKEVMPEQASHSLVSSEMPPLQGVFQLNKDDIFHMMADYDGLLSTLSLFVSDAKKFFATEFAIWTTVRDLLVISPQLFSSATLKMCMEESQALQQAIVATALVCLSLREDVSPAQATEIVHAISTGLREAKIAKSFQNKTVSSSKSSQVYNRLWPDLIINDKLSAQFKGLAQKAKLNVLNSTSSQQQSAETKTSSPFASSNLYSLASSVANSITGRSSPEPAPKSPKSTPAPQKNITFEFESKALSPKPVSSGDSQQAKINTDQEKIAARHRTGSITVDCDVSEQAILARKQQRMVKFDVTEDIRDVDLHGYLEKKSPQAPFVWQRRWFLVHKVQEERTSQWKLALSWHESHSAPVKSRLFLEEVERIDLVAKIPARLAADGISLVLMKEKVSARSQGEVGYEFNVVTKQRVYHLRGTSMSETITWINGLNKASREAKRLAAVLKTSVTPRGKRFKGPQVFESLDMTQLRSLCTSKGLHVNFEMERSELIEMLRSVDDETVNKDKAAEKADSEEKKKILLSKSIRELKTTCESSGFDTSSCVNKIDLVNMLMNQDKDAFVDKAEQEAHLRQLIARGLCMLEEEETAMNNSGSSIDQSNIENAVGIFERVAREANSHGFSLIEARAMHGLASAYSISPDRKDASPMMFEMASNMFFAAGERSDARSCVMDASEMYRLAGQYEDAIRALVEYDTKAKSLDFSATIEQLRHEAQKKTKAQNSRFGRFAQYFSS